MKITQVTASHIAIPYDHGAPKPLQTSGRERANMDAVYIKVETDAGVVGWGEAYGFSCCPVTAAATRLMVAPLVEGRHLGPEGSNSVTPADVTILMADLRKRTQSAGLNGPVGFALSGLDIALWDIAGKTSGTPLHALVGDGGHERIAAYASLLKLGRRDNLERVLDKARSRGFRMFKVHERTVEMVAVARAFLGDGVALMVDTNCAFTPDEAIAMAEKFLPYDLTWFEEPIYPPDDFEALARLRKVGVPIAIGENLGNLNDIKRVIAAGGVDIVQPDVSKQGGVTEFMKALRHAHEMGVMAEPHAPYYGPALIASVHCLAAMKHETMCEYFFSDLADYPIGEAAIPRDGWLHVPQGPGLGIEVDEKLLEKYRVS